MSQFHSNLKSETTFQHESLEACVDIFERCNDLFRYHHLLWTYLQFYRAFEAKLKENKSPQKTQSPFTESGYRYIEKSHLLQKDLEELQSEYPDIKSQSERLTLAAKHLDPPIDFDFLLKSASHCLGFLYVMEGSLLGGIVITRRLKLKLQQDTFKTLPIHFFEGNGKDTWKVWAVFCDLLEDSELFQVERNNVIESAKLTFETFENWVKRSDELLKSIRERP